ncbi:MAG TPA: DNA-processing protein DprA [Chloroflexota bacterium]|nr:DNA-processing protein DprA [Chloroflexota bacterium]
MTNPEREAWVALCTVAGIGPIRFQRLLEVCGDAQSAWAAPGFQLAAVGLERRSIEALLHLRSQTTPEAIAARLQRLGISTLTLQDAEYPSNLREIADPPPVLFVRGQLTEQDSLAVALVGTRRATTYGIAVAERLATDLAGAGVTVVSGLALGVDTAAHRAAVQAGGRTIAVLGNGLDQIYPPSNRQLAQRIASAAGALVSEFSPGTPPDAINFPRRNRIIAGLSRVTVIIEAGERSGALITADFALEQGRDVLAVPGSILSPTCTGSNDLLKQGATPVTGVDDILAALGMPVATGAGLVRGVPLDEQESFIWQALGADPRHVDDLARSLGRGAGEVSATLAMLELNGMARQVGSMLYTRA